MVYGKMDGSGKGVGMNGGARRNRNTKPCAKGTKKGTGKGKNRV